LAPEFFYFCSNSPILAIK